MKSLEKNIRLRELIKKSSIKPVNQQWLDDEIFAVTLNRLEDYYLQLVDSDKNISNEVNSSILHILGVSDPPSGPPKGLSISKGRNDLGDIDVDIMDARRHEVKDYLARKFKNVASISTFTYFKDKGVVRDASRVIGVPLGDVNKVLKTVDTYEDFVQGQNSAWFRQKYPDVVKIANYLRGRIRSVGMHAAGIVVASEPINKYAPIETRTDKDNSVSGRIPVVGYDMNEAESLGLIKIDALGLKTLSVIYDSLASIKEIYGTDINLQELDMDDPEVYRNLSNGFTKGVFQAEAVPYTNLLVKMGVDNFDQLVASNALVRPGAMNTVGGDYIARKQGRQQPVKIHDIYDEITKETLGLCLYQEQVMLLCNKLAGMSWSDADKIRKIIGKKKDVQEFEQYRSQFIDGATQHINSKIAEKLWHDFEAHSNYSFNKCLSGSTLVRRASSGRYITDPNISIKELYDKWHSNTPVGNKYRSRGLKIMALDSDGRVRPQRIKSVYQNGMKKVYRVTLSNGAYIDATSNHRHLTDSGYMTVDELSVGDMLFYSDFMYEPTEYVKSVGSGWGKNANRAMASDGRMRPSLGGYHSEYTKNVKLLTDNCAHCGSSNGRLEVAHLNSNNKDNRLENLARLCNSCHKKLDYKFGSRKPRHSKGYSVQALNIVSIDYIGMEMTYDIEMDSVEHNFLANGIVTHNSHAVAYSTLSYWTAWLKHYYPREFMYSILKNETDKDALTDYLIEAKRLKIPVYLPHVNTSKADFSIHGDGIMFGLSNVKFISDTIADRLMAKAPFESYEDLLDRTVREKGSGINSRAIDALNNIGGARFDDNPLRGDEDQYFYEYLNIPKFHADKISDTVMKSIESIVDFEETGSFVFYAMVKSIKRGTGWSRVEIVDSSGSVGIFHNENTQIETGSMYIFLVSDNRIMRYIDVDELTQIDDDPFVRWLNIDSINIDHDKKVVLAFANRKTKKGQNMAYVTLSNQNKELISAIVFPRQYPRALGKMVPGAVVDVELKRLDNGLMIKEIK